MMPKRCISDRAVCSITARPGWISIQEVYYRWWIQTINCKGEGPWSNYKSFRYQNRSPGRSTPISPRGLIFLRRTNLYLDGSLCSHTVPSAGGSTTRRRHTVVEEVY